MGPLIFVVILVILLISIMKIVPESQGMVIETLGRYTGTWQRGIHFKIPVIQQIRKKVSFKEQVNDFPPQPVITKDNVTIKIDSVIYYSIFDARLFTYGVENPIIALENLTATTLRNIVGELELDDTLTSRDIINTKMREILDDATDPWGIKVNRVELKNIIPPREIQEAMEKQMKAEREKRETLLEAEAHKQAVVARAEGDKQAKILAAEAERDAQIALATGRAESIRLTYDAEAKGLELLREARTDANVLVLKKLETLKEVADGRATKIFMPNDLTDIVGGLGVAGEALGVGDYTKIDMSPKEKKETTVDVCCDDDLDPKDFTKKVVESASRKLRERLRMLSRSQRSQLM